MVQDLLEKSKPTMQKWGGKGPLKRAKKQSGPMEKKATALPLQKVIKRMQKLNDAAKKLVDEGKTNIIYDWDKLQGQKLGIQKEDLPVLTRLVCEHRNISWGLEPEGLSPEEEEMVHLQMSEKQLEDQVEETQNPDQVGKIQMDELQHALQDEDLQPIRPGVLTQVLPGTSNNTVMMSPESQHSSPTESRKRLQPFQDAVGEKSKRVKIVAPDSTPSSPQILTKNALRAKGSPSPNALRGKALPFSLTLCKPFGTPKHPHVFQKSPTISGMFTWTLSK